MTTINTVEDIIEALDADPLLLDALRSRLLTRELLELPQVVKELAASHLRLESTLHQFMEAANARLNALETNQREMMAEQRAMRASQEAMKTDLDFIKGSHMEMRLQGKAESLLHQRMNLQRVQIVRALYPAGSMQWFLNALYDAEENGRITDRHYRRILDTDMILRGRRRGGDEYVYVAMEVSNKLDRDDIDRAIMSAEAISRTLDGAEVLPAVYGREISDADNARAENNGVTVMLDELRP